MKLRQQKEDVLLGLQKLQQVVDLLLTQVGPVLMPLISIPRLGGVVLESRALCLGPIRHEADVLEIVDVVASVEEFRPVFRGLEEVS